MLSEIGSSQLQEWLAFAALEGFGERRADLRMGIIASTIANVHRDPKRKPSPFKPADFMPRIKDDEIVSQEAELKSALDRIAVKPKRKG
jgi:hypothetical protein